MQAEFPACMRGDCPHRGRVKAETTPTDAGLWSISATRRRGRYPQMRLRTRRLSGATEAQTERPQRVLFLRHRALPADSTSRTRRMLLTHAASGSLSARTAIRLAALLGQQCVGKLSFGGKHKISAMSPSYLRKWKMLVDYCNDHLVSRFTNRRMDMYPIPV